MKILWLYDSLPQFNYAHWYHGDFMKVVNTIPNIQVKFYGWNISKLYPEEMLCPYNNNLTIKDLYEMFPFDVLILWNKSRQEHAPKGIDKVQTLKVWIEGDYFRWRKTDWLNTIKPDLILHRHKCCAVMGIEDFPDINQMWLPCSVNTNIFKPTDALRKPKIGFAGSCNSQYPYRKTAKETLKKDNLLDDKKKQIEKKYLSFLQQYIGYLNCSTTHSIDNAKAFEILASGGVLLTNKCENGFVELFGKNSYMTYKNDCSDVVSQAKKILSNGELQKELITNGLDVIHQKHTHEIRALELVNILKENLKIPTNSNVLQEMSESFNFIKKIESSLIKEIVKPVEKPIILTGEEKIKLLLDNNIDVCLLKDSCLNLILNNTIINDICIAVNNEELSKQLLGEDIIFEEWPQKTKRYRFNGLNLYVPLPSVRYLVSLYGKEAKTKLKELGYSV